MSDFQLAALEVSGMTCDDCARHVTAALEGAGAQEVSVAWKDGEARFSWPSAVSELDLRAAVSGSGYRPGVLKVIEEGQKKTARWKP